jgi:hypothetical protein
MPHLTSQACKVACVCCGAASENSLQAFVKRQRAAKNNRRMLRRKMAEKI